MNNKIVSTKTTSAIFLAIVLVTGTFAVISPSFIIGVNAQAVPYGMDNYDDRKSYGIDDSYGPIDYRDDKKKDDSYGYSDYGMDSSYDKKPPVYGMDSSYDDRKSYDNKKSNGNDNSYKSQYTSYGKDDKRDKSSKDNKSVNINKIKCINTNLNINGNNAGNVSIGNKGQGYLGTYSSGGSGGYGGDGYDKQGKGFECIINNNNTNNNVVGGGGNVTDGGGGNQTLSPCEECFERLLNASELAQVEVRLAPGLTLSYGPNQQITFNSLATLCEDLEFLAEEFGNAPNNPIPSVLIQALINTGGLVLTGPEIAEIERCVLEALGLEPR